MTTTGVILRFDGTNGFVPTTSTYPTTNAVSTILYASSANVMAALPTANSAVLATNSSGVPSITATPTVTSITLGSGTALANYVQGTWTPAITFGGAAVGVTYTQQTGQYTRIGNLVFISCNLTLSAAGSSTGAVVITGLPVTVAASSNQYGMAINGYQGFQFAATFTQMWAVAVEGGTTLALYKSAPIINTAYVALNNTTDTVQNTFQVRFEGFYIV